jgi:DUF971 family protein
VSEAFEPVDIDVDRLRGVTITWADGTVDVHALADLRRACTCAECRGRRERGQPVGPRPGDEASVAIVTAELVGAWGINFAWNDGHSSGIFGWDVLAQLAVDHGPGDQAP